MYQGLFQIQEIQYNSFYGNISSFRLQIQCRYNVSSSVPDTVDTYLTSRTVHHLCSDHGCAVTFRAVKR